jgi:hypothetical protein
LVLGAKDLSLRRLVLLLTLAPGVCANAALAQNTVALYNPTPTPTAACNYFQLTPMPSAAACAPYGTCPQAWEARPTPYESINDLSEASVLQDPGDTVAPYKCAISTNGAIGTAISLDGIHWKKRADNPVFNGVGRPGNYAGRVCLAKNPAGLYIIFFSSSSLEHEITATDFAGTWSYSGTPTIASGSVPGDGGAENSSVYFDPATGIGWMIWEHVCADPGPGGTFQLELLKSTDNGRTFQWDTTAPHPLLDLSKNISRCANQANAPSRLYRDSNGCFNMLYTTNADCAQIGDIYWAQSCDYMHHWTVSSKPVITHVGNCYGITGCDQAGDPEWWQTANGNVIISYAVAANALGGGTGVFVSYPGPACQYFTCSGNNTCITPTATPTVTRAHPKSSSR